jgi:regulator of protease activity HflC (stomatin/prohibitin superfamily)
MNRDYWLILIVVASIPIFLFLFLIPRMFIPIGPGELGVLYRLLWGTAVDEIYGEGLQFISPLNTMYIYNIRVQEVKRTLDVLTFDGLVVQLELSIRYHPDPDMLGVLHVFVGPNYVDQIVVPIVASVVRTTIGQLTIEQLYTGEAPQQIRERREATITGRPLSPEEARFRRPDFLPDIIARALTRASKRYVVIDEVIIITITIPAYVQEAIQEKLRQQQLAQAQDYRIKQAQLERDVKTYEADANKQLSDSLTPQILQWRGIEATRELATSPNSKIIVIGNGPEGLPIILGADR